MNEEIKLTDEDIDNLVDGLNFVHDPKRNKIDTYDYYDYPSKNRKYKKNSLRSPYDQVKDLSFTTDNLTKEIAALKARIKELEEENAELKIDIETYKNMES